MFYFGCFFFQRSHTWLFTCISVNAEPCTQYRRIQYQKKNKNLFDLRKNILSRNKQNIDFNTSFYQYIVTFRVYNLAKYCHSLFFIDSIAFNLNKRSNLHLVSLFYKNCSYPTWTACLYSLSSSFSLLLSKLFNHKETSLFFYWPHSKNKVRILENVPLLTIFE